MNSRQSTSSNKIHSESIINKPRGSLLPTDQPISYGPSEDIYHTVVLQEQVAFAHWVNCNLSSDNECKPRYLPFNDRGDDLYVKCTDGILLCKIINVCAPGTIDERAINKSRNLSIYQRHENLQLAINSAKSIGCCIVNNGADDLEKGNKHLFLGLLWQIIKVGLWSELKLQVRHELVALMQCNESLEDFLKLSPVDLLLRWVNYHLNKAGCRRTIHNFSDDIKDSEIYAYLIPQIAPKEKANQLIYAQTVISQPNYRQRAEMVLNNADKLDARMFVTPDDILEGNKKLNMAFVANLFNKYPALDPAMVNIDDEIMETREEKTFRNWINSMLPNSYVNYLYSDLQDGLILLKLFDIIRPNTVDKKRVNFVFNKRRENFEKLENCNYVVELGKKFGFSLVGIGGDNIRNGDKTSTLSIVWQLMRAYTLSLLSKLAINGSDINDNTVLQWAQQKLRSSNKYNTINSFQDPSLCTGLALLDLIDAVTPGSVDYKLVKTGKTHENCLSNAKYAISVARKTGANVYALPEDITEVKSKMILTIVACLMVMKNNH